MFRFQPTLLVIIIQNFPCICHLLAKLILLLPNLNMVQIRPCALILSEIEAQQEETDREKAADLEQGLHTLSRPGVRAP